MNAPSAEQVRTARAAAGLTQAQAAALVHLGHVTRWAEYERGKHTMPAATWELFLIKAGLHPAYNVPSDHVQELRASLDPNRVVVSDSGEVGIR